MHDSPGKVFLLNLSDEESIAPKLGVMKLEHEEFSSIDRLLANINLASLGCVIADLNHFGLGGMDILQQLNQRQSTLPLILLARRVSTRLVVRVMREGALNLIEKPADEDELFFAIREAFEESGRRVRMRHEQEAIKSKFAPITSTEFQVLDAVCTGKTNKQIAESLDVSVRTVEARKKRLLNKTECSSQPELIIAYQTFKSMHAPAASTRFSGAYSAGPTSNLISNPASNLASPAAGPISSPAAGSYSNPKPTPPSADNAGHSQAFRDDFETRSKSHSPLGKSA